MKKAFLLVLLTASILHNSFSQNRSDSYFKNGETINFIGNSITHGVANEGSYHNYILLFQATRFPHEKITVRNLGIWGDNVSDIKRRLSHDILTVPAEKSLIMAGMNDVNRELYKANATVTEIANRPQYIKNFKDRLNEVIPMLQQAGSEVVLQTPTIFDETLSPTTATNNRPGVNVGLQQCIAIVNEMATKYSVATVVDYWTILNDLNQQLQSTDPTKTFISTDRIHPKSDGHFVMAYQFLKSTNAPKYVANVEIENGAITKNQFCTVSDIVATNSSVSFKYKPESLPFPIVDEVNTALAYIPFQDELNNENLKVASLAAGKYALNINGQFVANYTAQELATGVNLALQKNTPQYQQALAVKAKADAYRKLQVRFRDMKFVEIKVLPESMWNDFAAAQAEFERLRLANDSKYNNNKTRILAYLQDKPNQVTLIQELSDLNDDIFSINKPEEYLIEVFKSSQTHLWDFNGAVVGNKVEGWNIMDYTSASTSNSILNLTIANSANNGLAYYVGANGNATIDPAISKYAVIKLKNGTAKTQATFFWQPRDESGTILNKKIDFNIVPNDTQFREYVVDLGSNEAWKAPLNQPLYSIFVRVPYTNVTAADIDRTVEIDYIKLTEENDVLPVKLISFTGKNDKDGVVLDWATASETNNSHFNVLRSIKGDNFINIGRVDGNWNSNTRINYQFRDNAPVAGFNYYQLEQVDKNGDKDKSAIIDVNFNFNTKGSSLKCYITQEKNVVIEVNANKESAYSVGFTSIEGKKISGTSGRLVPGNNTILIPLQKSLTTGIYVLTYVNMGKTVTAKILVP